MAASLLDRAADAILADDIASAINLIADANMPDVWTYARCVMGKYDDDIHRYLHNGVVKETLTTRGTARMPDSALTLAVYRRDGFRCRYCEMPVVLSAARRAMIRIAPNVLLWPPKDDQKHAAFYALTAVVDHLVPHARGGTNNPENLVTSCQSCNYGKGNYLIEELQLLDPRDRAPIVDEWDGLLRLLGIPQPKNAAGPRILERGSERSTPRDVVIERRGKRMKSTEMTSSMDQLHAFQPQYAEQLNTLLQRCVAAGAEWQLKKALLLRLTAAGGVLEILGINQDGTVEIPWSLVDHKPEFRGFVDRLASVIEESEVYCTPKGWWRVRKSGRKLTLAELLAVADTLVLAIAELRAVIAS